jgi:hypothetical protein
VLTSIVMNSLHMKLNFSMQQSKSQIVPSSIQFLPNYQTHFINGNTHSRSADFPSKEKPNSVTFTTLGRGILFCSLKCLNILTHISSQLYFLSTSP